MKEIEFQNALEDILTGYNTKISYAITQELGTPITCIKTLDGAGISTEDKGLVVILDNGDKFKLTIEKSDDGELA